MWDIRTGRALFRFKGVTGQYQPAAFSPDGSAVVFAEYRPGGQDVAIWNAKTGEFIRPLRTQPEEVLSVGYSPDGRLVVCSGSHKVTLWDPQTGQCIRSLEGGDPFCFSPDGSRLAIHIDGGVGVFNLRTGSVLRKVDLGDSNVSSAVFSPDGLTLLIAYGNNSLGLWSLGQGKFLWKTSSAGDFLYWGHFSHNGRAILSAEYYTAGIRDVRTGAMLHELKGPEKAMQSATFSHNGSFVVTGSESGTADLWNAKTGKLIAVLRGQKGQVNYVAFTPDDRWIVTASTFGVARVWNGRTGTLVRQMHSYVPGGF